MTIPRRRKAAYAALALAASTLVALGWNHGETLVWIGLLRHGDTAVRARAAGEIVRRRSLRATPHLLRALREDSAASVQFAAAEALGDLGPDVGEEAIRALVGAVPTLDRTTLL